MRAPMHQWLIAIRNLARQRVRTGLTLAAIAFGAASLMLAAGFVNDSLRQLETATVRGALGHIRVFAPGAVDSGLADPLRFALPDEAAVLRAARSLPGVLMVEPVLSFAALLGDGRSQWPVLVEAMDPAVERSLGASLAVEQGRWLQARDRGALMVGRTLQEKARMALGAPANLLLVLPEGEMNTLDAEVAGVFRSFSREYDERVVRVSLEDARAATAGSQATSVAILLEDGATLEASAAALRERLGAAADVRTWLDLSEFYRNARDFYQRQFAVLQFMVFLVVVLAVASTVNMALSERVAEFGTMRALGARPSGLVSQVLLEYSVLGLLGAAAGVALGFAAAWIASSIGIPMPPPPGSEVPFVARISPTALDAAVAAVVGALTGPCACLLPALRVARQPIVDALREAV